MKKQYLSTLIFILFLSSFSQAQFVSTNGPTLDGEFAYVWARNDTAFAAKDANLWRTFNGGQKWEVLLGKGLPDQVDPRAITVCKGMIFIGTNKNSRVYTSSDWGESWKANTQGASIIWVPTHITSNSNNVLIGGTTFEPHYYDFDNNKWVSSSLSGITHALHYQEDGSVIACVGSVSKSYTQISKDGGKTWTQTKEEPKIPSVGISGRTFDVLKVGSRFISITNLNGYNPYYSDDNGDTWTEASGAKTTGLLAYGRKLLKLPDGTVLLNKTGILYSSKDTGKTWSTLMHHIGNDFTLWKSDEIFASTGLIEDGGTGTKTGFQFASNGFGLQIKDGKVYSFTSNSLSAENYWHHYNGSVWNKDSVTNKTSLFNTGNVYNTTIIGDSFYLCTSNGLIGGTSSSYESIYRAQFQFKAIGAFTKIGNSYFAGTFETRGNVKPKIFYSSDDLKSFQESSFSNNIGFGAGGTANSIESIFPHKGVLIADMTGGYAISKDNGKNWEWLGGSNAGHIVSDGNVLVKVKDNLLGLNPPRTVQISEDNGENWSDILKGIPGYSGQTNFTNFGDVYVVEGKIYLEAFEGGRKLVQLNTSSKEWENTTKNSNIPSNSQLLNLSSMNSILYANIKGEGVFKMDGTAGFRTIKKQQAAVYPNPCIDVLHLKGEHRNVRVYDQKGTLILQEQGVVNQLNLSNLPSGMYVLKSNHNKHESHSLIMKK